jgi:hypothetical protein
LILQPYLITTHLVLGARHRSPQTLFAIGHEAQNQLLGYQALYQTFGIAKVVLAPSPPAVRQRLRQMRRA